MRIKIKLLISCLFLFNIIHAQSVSQICKIDYLLNRIKSPDTTYVLNFWATWCKPCIEELPAFDSLQTHVRTLPVKIILVSLDFKENIDNKVNPFLKKQGIKTECILLDEINGNDFIDKIYKGWSGSIPSTLFKKGNQSDFIEKKMNLKDLQTQVNTTSKK